MSEKGTNSDTENRAASSPSAGASNQRAASSEDTLAADDPSTSAAPEQQQRAEEGHQTGEDSGTPIEKHLGADMWSAHEKRAQEEEAGASEAASYADEHLHIQRNVVRAAWWQVRMSAAQAGLLLGTVIAAFLAFHETQKATGSAQETVKLSQQSLALSQDSLKLTQQSVKASQDAANYARESADSAKQMLEAQNRAQSAWIGLVTFPSKRVTPGAKPGSIQGYLFQPEFINTGPTPATKVITTTVYAVAPYNTPFSEIKFPPPRQRRPDSHTIIGPQAKIDGMRTFIPSTTLKAAFAEGKVVIYLQFRIDYSDIFGHSHTTEQQGMLAYWGDVRALDDFSVPFIPEDFTLEFMGRNTMD